MIYNGLLHKYGHLLDLPTHTTASAVSLLEGNTPLIPADNLCRQLGGGFELFIKYEGLNPTGSFKDRGMTAAVSEALGRGAGTVICASTGNTAASAAAYAARAGLKCIVLIPQGKVAAGKLAGAIAYAAVINPQHNKTITGKCISQYSKRLMAEYRFIAVLLPGACN